MFKFSEMLLLYFWDGPGRFEALHYLLGSRVRQLESEEIHGHKEGHDGEHGPHHTAECLLCDYFIDALSTDESKFRCL